MPENVTSTLPKVRADNSVKMGAKIANQINTNQQSNVVLSAYCVVTQVCTTININFA
ncbi:MAG TPA: hypothetical protein GXX36_07345 [Clostridiaceae bacterium]|nr:hypothetical protein [Clostridiaceae bacterium]